MSTPVDKMVSFYTIGCRSNQAETAILKNLFRQKGFSISSVKKPCDIAVINTCTVTEKSDQDARKLVLRINRLSPRARIALIGCQSQTQSQELSQLPGVKWVVGNQEKMNLADIVLAQDQDQKTIIISPPVIPKEFIIPAISHDRERTRANIKIQEGCDCFCAFCEVPYARGPARSRTYEDITRDAIALAKQGYCEIVLTGTNIGLYRDRHRRLIDLLHRLNAIAGILRIRISSIEPNAICDNLILFMGSKTKLCRHLHLSLQSGSDDILQKMGRPYTVNNLKKIFDFIITNVPDICLGADIITGFPGENQKHFDETVTFLKNAPLAYVHTFRYSNRKFARSKDFQNQISKSIIVQRSTLLREISRQKKENFLKKFVGTYQKVLFEKQKENVWQGLTDHYLRVKAISNNNLRNQIHHVKIISVQDEALLGTLMLKGGFYGRNSDES